MANHNGYEFEDSHYFCPACNCVWAQDAEKEQNNEGRFICWWGEELPVAESLFRIKLCGCNA